VGSRDDVATVDQGAAAQNRPVAVQQRHLQKKTISIPSARRRSVSMKAKSLTNLPAPFILFGIVAIQDATHSQWDIPGIQVRTCLPKDTQFVG
jgi:hypothetical protein